MISDADLALVAVLCVVAGVASDKFTYLPVFLALLSPGAPVSAAFIGMVASLLLSGVYRAVYRRMS